MEIDRDEIIARCRVTGMDADDAAEFADDVLDEIEHEADAVYHRLIDLANNLPPYDYRDFSHEAKTLHRFDDRQ